MTFQKKRRQSWSVLWRLFCCRFARWILKTAWPSAWDTRPWPWEGEPENAAGRGQESHAGRTAHPVSTGQNGQLKIPDELTGRDSQIFACQLARCRSAEDAVLCPSDMMLCVISYWVLSGAKRRQIQQLRCFVLSRNDVETEIRKIIYGQIIYI